MVFLLFYIVLGRQVSFLVANILVTVSKKLSIINVETFQS